MHRSDDFIAGYGQSEMGNKRRELAIGGLPGQFLLRVETEGEARMILRPSGLGVGWPASSAHRCCSGCSPRSWRIGGEHG
jgi:hypothetical protein